MTTAIPTHIMIPVWANPLTYLVVPRCTCWDEAKTAGGWKPCPDYNRHMETERKKEGKHGEELYCVQS